MTADAEATAPGDSSAMEELARPSIGSAPLAPRVSDAMHWGVVHCAPEATLREVATVMADAGVHCVVILGIPGDRGSLWGVVSDLDLVAAATLRSLDDQQAGGTAMRPAITAFPHESLATAAQRMTAHGVSHLVVVDDVRHRPVGVVSTLDLVHRLAGEMPSGGVPGLSELQP